MVALNLMVSLKNNPAVDAVRPVCPSPSHLQLLHQIQHRPKPAEAETEQTDNYFDSVGVQQRAGVCVCVCYFVSYWQQQLLECCDVISILHPHLRSQNTGREVAIRRFCSPAGDPITTQPAASGAPGEQTNLVPRQVDVSAFSS